MKGVVPHKIGDTFQCTCTFRDPSQTPIDLSGITIASQVRDSSLNLLATLAVTQLDQTQNPGKFTLRAEAGVTANWPIGLLLWDIKYTDSSNVTRTQTMQINCYASVTQ